jgi:putative PIG3 family NAD(P)H quinone oxidoreductase
MTLATTKPTTIRSTMREVRFDGAGGPEVIRLTEAPVPAPGRDQVLIAVAAAGVNRPDCLQRAGGYPPPPGATDVPGLEVAGEIVALGEGVAADWLGRPVTALLASGGYAEYAVADKALCLPAPGGLTLVEAAGLPETVFTVFDNVFTRGRLVAGETLLVHGGSSGIGSTAIQMAKARGATVFATAGSDEKCAFCRTLGADAAINYRTHDFASEVARLTDRRGVDVILDMVGGDYTPRNIASLAVEGRLVQIAFLKGSRAELDLRPVMMRRLTLTGSTLRPRSLALKAAIAERVLAEIWPLIEAGAMRPVIHATFPLEEARAAHELMESSAHLGKIMLTIGR